MSGFAGSVWEFQYDPSIKIQKMFTVDKNQEQVSNDSPLEYLFEPCESEEEKDFLESLLFDF